MKANGLRSFVYKGILLILLSLYFLLVFSRPTHHSLPYLNQTATKSFAPSISQVDTPLPKLLSFEGISSNKKVKLNWKFETTQGLDECVLERADKSGNFKAVAYFFMTEDIHIPNLRYTDSVPKNKKYYYRLRMTGKNGDQQCTKTLAFKLGAKQDQKASLEEPIAAQ